MQVRFSPPSRSLVSMGTSSLQPRTYSLRRSVSRRIDGRVGVSLPKWRDSPAHGTNTKSATAAQSRDKGRRVGRRGEPNDLPREIKEVSREVKPCSPQTVEGGEWLGDSGKRPGRDEQWDLGKVRKERVQARGDLGPRQRLKRASAEWKKWLLWEGSKPAHSHGRNSGD